MRAIHADKHKCFLRYGVFYSSVLKAFGDGSSRWVDQQVNNKITIIFSKFHQCLFINLQCRNEIITTIQKAFGTNLATLVRGQNSVNNLFFWNRCSIQYYSKDTNFRNSGSTKNIFKVAIYFWLVNLMLKTLPIFVLQFLDKLCLIHNCINYCKNVVFEKF